MAYDPFAAIDEQLRVLFLAPKELKRWPKPPELIWWQDLQVALVGLLDGHAVSQKPRTCARHALRFLDALLGADDVHDVSGEFRATDDAGFEYWVSVLVAMQGANGLHNLELTSYEADFSASAHMEPDIHQLEDGYTPASLAAEAVSEIGVFSTSRGHAHNYVASFDANDGVFSDALQLELPAAGDYQWRPRYFTLWEVAELHTRIWHGGIEAWQRDVLAAIKRTHTQRRW